MSYLCKFFVWVNVIRYELFVWVNVIGYELFELLDMIDSKFIFIFFKKKLRKILIFKNMIVELRVFSVFRILSCM